MHSFVTPQKEDRFFFNTEQPKQFVSTAESKQNDIIGHVYFKKINTFIEQHVHVGELYLEYIKGDCQQNGESFVSFARNSLLSEILCTGYHVQGLMKPLYQIRNIYHLMKLLSLHQKDIPERYMIINQRLRLKGM